MQLEIGLDYDNSSKLATNQLLISFTSSFNKLLIRRVTFNKNKLGTHPYEGPFRIAKVIGASTYLLAKADGSPMPNRAPVPLRRLLPYHEIEQVQDFSEEIIKLLEASTQVASSVREGAGGYRSVDE